jgi:hypothetical protein
VLDKFPFTSYDFWAYLASGFLLLAAVDLAAGTGLLLLKDWTWPQTAIAVAAAYVAGQLMAGVSSLVLERGLVGKLLGWPRDNLFGQSKVWPWVRVCLASYYTELPANTRQAALAKGKALGIDGPGEQLFWPAFTACKSNSKAMERMDNFLNMYGFARNIATVAFVDAAILGWSYYWRGSNPLHGNVALVCLAVGIGMTFRYIKFLRHYGVEVFTTFAYAKEGK